MIVLRTWATTIITLVSSCDLSFFISDIEVKGTLDTTSDARDATMIVIKAQLEMQRCRGAEDVAMIVAMTRVITIITPRSGARLQRRCKGCCDDGYQGTAGRGCVR